MKKNGIAILCRSMRLSKFDSYMYNLNNEFTLKGLGEILKLKQK